jgi:hypothetical protein
MAIGVERRENPRPIQARDPLRNRFAIPLRTDLDRCRHIRMEHLGGGIVKTPLCRSCTIA